MFKHGSVLSVGCILLYLVVHFTTTVFAQGPDFRNVVPPSPDVASLGKFGAIPVSYYTGIPNISIPLYEIRNGNLSLPISLAYHAAGVKVEEVSSSVGLSWSLRANGVISRSVRGLPDDISQWESQPEADEIENIMLSGLHNDLVRDVVDGLVDGEADLYTYNFGNHSGQFVYDQDGVPHTIPQENLLITPSGAGWKIVDETGTSYFFTKTETVSSSSCSGDQLTTSAWFLTSIVSSDLAHTITFTYEDIAFDYSVRLGETKYFSTNGGTVCIPNPMPCVGNQAYFTQRLKEIDFESGYVKFNYFNSRCDVWNDKMLDEIEVFTSDDQLVKKFVLSHSYFGDNGNCNFETTIAKRLKLESVTEWNGTTANPPYVFTYNESIALPDRLSTSQDHWGYFNGKQNVGLIAGFSTVVFSGAQVYFPGADRSTDPTKIQAGILTGIKYPTRGETLFEYEANMVNDDRFEPLYQNKYLSYTVNDYLVSSLPDPLGATAMVLPAGGAQVEFSNITGLDALWAGCDIVELWATKDGQPYRKITNFLNGIFEHWPAGTYSLILITECGTGSLANFNVLVTARVPINPGSDMRYVGGLRVKRIEDIPGNGGESIVREYRYEMEDDPSKSSGVLINFPQYSSDLGVESYTTDEFGSPTGPPTYCAYRVRSSFSNYPLATTNGGYVGYTRVIEDMGDNGETHYSYVTYEDPIPQFPFAPVEYFDWRRGFLSNVKNYARVNEQLSLIKETINTPTEINEFRVYGVKTGRDFLILRNGGMNNSLQPLPVYVFYPTISSFFGLMKTVERTYDPNDDTKWTEMIRQHSYNPQHLQIVESLTTTSFETQDNVEEKVTARKYPFDYVFSSTPVGTEAEGIKKLQDLHVANAIVDEVTIIQNRNKANNQISNQRVLSGSLTTYKSDKPYPDSVFRLETIQPIGLSTFGASSSLTANSFQKNGAFKRVASFVNYDDEGNILVAQKASDYTNAYIWGYNKLYPIAAIKNSPVLNDVAHTSFETGSDGSWVYNTSVPAIPGDGYPRTGQKSFLVSSTNTITRSNLTPAKQYMLSFWYKSGSSIVVTGGTQTGEININGTNNWILSTRNITGASSITISGTGTVDELRLYPVAAQITTYTYDPLIGMTSMTDENSQTTYYEYDSFGRLTTVKDQDGNIVKWYDYNYQVK